MTSHPPIPSTSWHLSRRASAGITAIFFLVSLTLMTPQAVSAQNAPKANSLIVWSALPTIQDVAGEIVAAGGRVDHIFPPNAAIVYVPSEKMADLTTRIAGLQIHQGAVEFGDINQSTDAGPIAAAVWNAAFMKASSPSPSRKRGRLRRDPPNDVRIAPDRQVALDGSKMAAPVPSNAPGFFDTSAYLVGSVTVGIITPESNGRLIRTVKIGAPRGKTRSWLKLSRGCNGGRTTAMRPRISASSTTFIIACQRLTSRSSEAAPTRTYGSAK